MLNDKDAIALAKTLTSTMTSLYRDDASHLAYYEGTSRLEELGIAIPPGLRGMEPVIAWPSVVVEAITERSEVRALLDRGSDRASHSAATLFERNSMDSQTTMFTRDKLIYGRAFFLVGANEEDPSLPVVTVESPREMAVRIDPRKRMIDCALKIWRTPTPRAPQGEITGATLYTPECTWVLGKPEADQWEVAGRNRHELGRVPVIMALNRQITGRWKGTSELTGIIPITDMAVRALTGLQYGLETVNIPRKFVVGAQPKDFVAADGKTRLTQWESYMSSVWALANKDAKVGQLPGADLGNYHETLAMYGRLAASVTGFPSSYFGIFSSNPAAEGAIRAEEARLVKTVERSNAETGKALSWVIDTATRITSGQWPAGNSVRVEWQDPGTPTFAQRADALQKLAGGKPVLSREGVWDLLGRSEARKQRERDYLEAEETDPLLGGVAEKNYGVDTEPAARGDSPL